MMSDSSIFKYGSGDGGINDGGGIVLETDDEDLNGSGSGSGDGSGQTPSPIDVTLAPSKTSLELFRITYPVKVHFSVVSNFYGYGQICGLGICELPGSYRL